MHNLTTLVKRSARRSSLHLISWTDPEDRLEAVTSRLEDIASSTLPLPTTAAPHPPSDVVAASKLVRECFIQSHPPTNSDTSGKAISRPLPESVEAFDAFIRDVVGNYFALSQQLGGTVSDQVRIPNGNRYYCH